MHTTPYASIRVRETDTVDRIKMKIFGKTNVPVAAQQLLFAGAELSSTCTSPAKELGLYDGATLTLVPRLSSGPLRAKTPDVAPQPAITQQAIMEAIAARVPLAQLRQRLAAHGQPLQIVVKINGHVVVVRLNAAPPEDGNTAGFVAAVDTAATQEQGSVDAQGDNVGETEVEKEEAKTHAKVSDILSRLQQQKASRRARNPHHVTSTVAAAGGKPSSARSLASHHRAPVVKSVNGGMGSRLPGEEEATGKKRPRCATCAAKVPLVHYPCKCGSTYCSQHRLAHTCSFDYRK